jgi:putative copper export protein
MTWDSPTLVYAAARWLGYLAAFLVVGAAAGRWLVGRRRQGAAGFGEGDLGLITLWGRLGSVLLGLALVSKLYLQARSLLEPEDPLSLDFLRAVLASTWGKGWLSQATAAIIALVGWRWLARRPSAAGPAWTAGLGSTVVVLTAPLTGHAIGLAEAPWYAPFLDLIHFGAGATWLGTLVMVWSVARRRDTTGASSLVEAYSPVALVAGLTTMLAGLTLALSYLGGLGPLLTTSYGRALLIKVAATGGTAVIGAYNWRVIGPRLRRGEPAPILQSAVAELAVGVVLLAITAVLVALPSPGESME